MFDPNELDENEVKKLIDRADGLARIMLANLDSRRSAGALQAASFLKQAKDMLAEDNDYKIAAFGVLCFASGILHNCGTKDADLPWIFEGKEANPDKQPQQLELAITGITGAQLLGQL